MKCLCCVKAGVEREREVKWSSVLLLQGTRCMKCLCCVKAGVERERERLSGVAYCCCRAHAA